LPNSAKDRHAAELLARMLGQAANGGFSDRLVAALARLQHQGAVGLDYRLRELAADQQRIGKLLRDAEGAVPAPSNDEA
jgi:hypothetical protein